MEVMEGKVWDVEKRWKWNGVRSWSAVLNETQETWSGALKTGRQCVAWFV